MNGTTPLIRIRQVTHTYADTAGRPTTALQGITLDIFPREFITIVGPSGCGKTTLLRLIAGLETPQSGDLCLDERPITAPGPDRGYVFQQAALLPWKTVEENIALGLRARHIYKQKRHHIPQYLRLIGLEGFAQAYPHEISGGMAQRVAIARALINEPKVLLMDEPLGALDALTRLELQDTIRRIWLEAGTTTILVTHDVDEAIYLSNRIIILSPRPGRITAILDVNLPSLAVSSPSSPDSPFPPPPDRDHPAFIALRRQILQALH